jgi:hypothetical protein
MVKRNKKAALPINWSAGLRPGARSRILKRAGSETGAPIARFRGSMREFLLGILLPREKWLAAP